MIGYRSGETDWKTLRTLICKHIETEKPTEFIGHEFCDFLVVYLFTEERNKRSEISSGAFTAIDAVYDLIARRFGKTVVETVDYMITDLFPQCVSELKNLMTILITLGPAQILIAIGTTIATYFT